MNIIESRAADRDSDGFPTEAACFPNRFFYRGWASAPA